MAYTKRMRTAMTSRPCHQGHPYSQRKGGGLLQDSVRRADTDRPVVGPAGDQISSVTSTRRRPISTVANPSTLPSQNLTKTAIRLVLSGLRKSSVCFSAPCHLQYGNHLQDARTLRFFILPRHRRQKTFGTLTRSPRQSSLRHLRLRNGPRPRNGKALHFYILRHRR